MTTRVVMEVFVSVVSGHLVILVYSHYLWHWPLFFFFFFTIIFEDAETGNS